MKLPILILLILLVASCGDTIEKEIPENDRLDLIPEPDKDLREAAEKIIAIRKNFQRINSLGNWTIKKVELMESTEGGEAAFYYQKDTLLKIVTQHFGETFKVINEYYIQDGKLSFAYQKHYAYNRPIMWDSTAMIDNDDDQVFDAKKSVITKMRSYFKNNMLIKQLNDSKDEATFTTDYLKTEEKRLLKRFKQLVELSKKE